MTVSGRLLGVLGGLALVLAVGVAACGTGSGGYNVYGGPPTNTPGGGGGSGGVAVNLTCNSGATVCTKQVALSGQATTVLANTNGMTLYYFMADTPKTSACTGGCDKVWPALTAIGSSVTGTSLSGALATLSDANGQQVTYNGHPLYTYSGDHAQTDATGNGFAGKWYAAQPSLAPASSGGGAGGY